MYENYIESQEFFTLPDQEDGESLPEGLPLLSDGDGAVAPGEDIATAPEVSSTVADPLPGLDPVMDLYTDMQGVQTVSSGDAALQALSADDPAALLASIDYKLTALLFFLVFVWCSGRIKNAVRGMTGRGIDD